MLSDTRHARTLDSGAWGASFNTHTMLKEIEMYVSKYSCSCMVCLQHSSCLGSFTWIGHKTIVTRHLASGIVDSCQWIVIDHKSRPFLPAYPCQLSLDFHKEKFSARYVALKTLIDSRYCILQTGTVQAANRYFFMGHDLNMIRQNVRVDQEVEA